MSEHSFSSVRLSSQGVFIRGIPFPLFSRVFVDWADVQHVEARRVPVWHRFHVMRPDLLWRWWTLDTLSAETQSAHCETSGKCLWHSGVRIAG